MIYFVLQIMITDRKCNSVVNTHSVDRTYLIFITTMNNEMQIEMLFSLEALLANATDVRSLGTMSQFVSFEVLLSLESRPANVTDVPPFDFVHR